MTSSSWFQRQWVSASSWISWRSRTLSPFIMPTFLAALQPAATPNIRTAARREAL